MCDADVITDGELRANDVFHNEVTPHATTYDYTQNALYMH